MRSTFTETLRAQLSGDRLCLVLRLLSLPPLPVGWKRFWGSSDLMLTKGRIWLLAYRPRKFL